MTFKDILIHLEQPGTAGPALAAAAELARAHGAHLTGLHVYDLAWPLLANGEGYLDPRTLQILTEEAEAASSQRARTLRNTFEEVLRREGLPGEWRQVEGNPYDVVALHARYADLAIFARGGEPDTEADLAESVLFASGRPVLVLPPAPAPLTARHVLIGWNGTREAARAVADAMPLMRHARTVRVLTIASEARGIPGSRIDAEDLARHLTRHGLEVIAETSRMGEPVEQVLLDTAAKQEADLLVIGGYGHGRLREMVLGGVTRHLLRHAPLPVLLSH